MLVADFHQQVQNLIVHAVHCRGMVWYLIRIKSKFNENSTILQMILFVKTRNMSACLLAVIQKSSKIKMSVRVNVQTARIDCTIEFRKSASEKVMMEPYAGRTSTSIICRRAATERRGVCALLFTICSM